MTPNITLIPGLDLTALTAAVFANRIISCAPAPQAPGPNSRISRLIRFRQENPGLFERRRVEGMKRSSLVRENLMRLHRERKEQWRASALKNPKLQATDQHIAAKMWRLKAPDGNVYEFRNLKKFVREHEDIFDADDVVWKDMNGKANQAWCRAFQALGRLRPTSSKHLAEWHGWRWVD